MLRLRGGRKVKILRKRAAVSAAKQIQILRCDIKSAPRRMRYAPISAEPSYDMGPPNDLRIRCEFTPLNAPRKIS